MAYCFAGISSWPLPSCPGPRPLPGTFVHRLQRHQARPGSIESQKGGDQPALGQRLGSLGVWFHGLRHGLISQSRNKRLRNTYSLKFLIPNLGCLLSLSSTGALAERTGLPRQCSSTHWGMKTPVRAHTHKAMAPLSKGDPAREPWPSLLWSFLPELAQPLTAHA